MTVQRDSLNTKVEHLRRLTHGVAIWQHLRERCCVAVSIYPLMPGSSVDVFIWDCEGPPWAKSHFQDHDLGANCMVLIVLCLWEGDVFLHFF